MSLISVVIITYNEEQNIARCLESVLGLADEIIVLDAFSTDRTVEIARSKGAIVRQQYFSGFVKQKNAALALASHNYVLSLDADEALDRSLVNSILKIKNEGLAGAYCMNRCTSYCGTYIRNGSWYPDRKVRLFDKRLAYWGGGDLHEKIEFRAAGVQPAQLKGDILHYSFPTIADHLKKCDKYSTISAKVLYARGKKSNWFKMTVNPLWAFFYGYIIRMGFLDGFYGFVIAINSAHATFLKYIKLYQLQRNSPANSYTEQPSPSKKPARELYRQIVPESSQE